jgi:putative pyruvate formate lyase activating enzyme
MLADTMINVQDFGCHNINLVTPTHFLPRIVSALKLAVPKGLRIPLVYNTGGYEKPEILRLLDGIVDIYLPDFKYMNPEHAALYSSDAYNYPHYAKGAFKEMQGQVGFLKTDGRGRALRGMMIRHLVLPNGISGTKDVLRFIAEEIGKKSYVNIMRQYRPEHRAREFPEIARRISRKEYSEALGWARDFGLNRLAR